MSNRRKKPWLRKYRRRWLAKFIERRGQSSEWRGGGRARGEEYLRQKAKPIGSKT